VRDAFPEVLRSASGGRLGAAGRRLDSPRTRRDTGPKWRRRNDELGRSSFDSFLRGDWDALAEVMDPQLDWLWYEPGDWDCRDRQKVLATLFERQREI
jgi:hypothetical protein